MAKKQSANTTAAIIEIGMNALRLKIAEGGKHQLKIIDELYHPLAIGRDAYANGRISVWTIDKICDVFKGFNRVMREYDVGAVQAFATSALYETRNMAYVQDMIKTRTGISVEVISPLDEKSYIYSEMTRQLLRYNIEPTTALLVYLGSNNLGVAYYADNKIPFIQNLKLGSLRLTSLFEDIQDEVENFSLLVEEYQMSTTQYFKKLLPSVEIGHFIACGREILTIAELCGIKQDQDLLTIPKEVFLQHYEGIKDKSIEAIMDEYGILEEKAELLFPSMSLYNALLRFTTADAIITPVVFLRDILLYKLLYPKQYQSWQDLFERHTVESAWYMAERYRCPKKHGAIVTKFALKIFDKMAKRHGLSKRERLLLETASILHDCGKYINNRAHDYQGYKIISNSDIIGLSSAEIEMVAYIVRYHSAHNPNSNAGADGGDFAKLPAHRQLVIAKLAAMLKLAEALDRSHNQKFDSIDVRINNALLHIIITSHKNISLEKWAFEHATELFQEVFGMQAVIRLKRVV